jgi:hypothetical protein
MLTALRKTIRAVPTPPLSVRLLSGTESLWDGFDAGIDRWDGVLERKMPTNEVASRDLSLRI